MPASPVALETAGRSCAEVVTIFDEGVPSTVPAEIIPTWVGRDDECSVFSESCWGEQEDLIGDESVKWGLLSGPPWSREGHPNQCRIYTELKLSWAANSPQPEISGGVQQAHREPLSSALSHVPSVEDPLQYDMTRQDSDNETESIVDQIQKAISQWKGPPHRSLTHRSNQKSEWAFPET